MSAEADGAMAERAAPTHWQRVALFVARRIWIVAAASALGHLGAWHWFIDLFAHFRWQYAAASLVCLAAALLGRRPRLVGISALVLLWNGALIAQYPLSNTRRTPTIETPFPDVFVEIAKDIATKPLKVVFANLAMAPSSATLFALIHAQSPDVIAVAELSSALNAKFVSEFSADYAVQILAPDAGWQGIGVMLKNKRLPGAIATLISETEFGFPTARLRWPGGELLVVHPIPPVASDAAAARDHYFAALARYAAAQDSAQTLIVTGDFNATVWSAPYREMLRTGGFVDSSTHFWPLPTWHGPSLLFAPLSVPIDQLLVRGPAAVRARRVISNPDSDHSMLLTELLIP
jgi:endonuclease/exonuclease/phosphatase (EEP) superfamily protein YafD